MMFVALTWERKLMLCEQLDLFISLHQFWLSDIATNLLCALKVVEFFSNNGGGEGVIYMYD